MPIGPNDVTLTGFTMTGGTVSATTLTGCLSTLATIGGSTLTVCNITGSTLAGNLASGTTITAPQLKGTSTLPIAQMTSSALLSTPVAGGIEYDGPCLYATDGLARRHLVPRTQVATLASSYVLTDSTAAVQRILNSSTTGAVNVGPNQAYLFECQFAVAGLATSNATVGFSFGGTANISAQSWQAICMRAAASSTPTAATISYHQAGSTAVFGAAAATAQGTALIKGKVVITTSGTLIPSIYLGSSSAGAPNIEPGAYFTLTPIGDNNVLTVGSWT